MLAPVVSAVMRRIVFDDLDVADQTGTRVSPLNEIVTQQRIAREPAIQYLMDGRYFINAFAREASFAIEILVGVGNGTRVDIESGLARIQRRQPRPRRTLHADSDAWLQDPVAGGHDVFSGIDDRLIQWMGHRANHPCSGSARKLGVGIKGDDVTHLWQNAQVADFHREAIVLAAQ